MSQSVCRKASRIGLAAPLCIAAMMLLGGCHSGHLGARLPVDHAYYAPTAGDEQSVFLDPIGHIDSAAVRRLGRLDVPPSRAPSETDLAARTRSRLTLPEWPQLSSPLPPTLTPQNLPQGLPQDLPRGATPGIPQAVPQAIPQPIPQPIPGVAPKEPAKPIHFRSPARPAAPGMVPAHAAVPAPAIVLPPVDAISDPVIGIVPRAPEAENVAPILRFERWSARR